jgi:hypothetical protein
MEDITIRTLLKLLNDLGPLGQLVAMLTIAYYFVKRLGVVANGHSSQLSSSIGSLKESVDGLQKHVNQLNTLVHEVAITYEHRVSLLEGKLNAFLTKELN